MDESHQVKRPVSPINGQPVPPSPFVKGVSFNPGGGPKGKRVSTWMAEYGDKPVSDWPIKGTPEYEKLPGNARIALKRLRSAEKEELTTRNSEYVEPRQVNQTTINANILTPESYDALCEAYFKAKARAQCLEQEKG